MNDRTRTPLARDIETVERFMRDLGLRCTYPAAEALARVIEAARNPSWGRSRTIAQLVQRAEQADAALETAQRQLDQASEAVLSASRDWQAALRRAEKAEQEAVALKAGGDALASLVRTMMRDSGAGESQTVVLWESIREERARVAPEPPRCGCRHSDAWRCLRDQGRTDRIACDCACHARVAPEVKNG